MQQIRQLIDDGQRAYRLRNSINNCPNFDNPIHKQAWKAGFHSAIHKISVDAALDTFIKENQNNYLTFSTNMLHY